MVHTWISLRNDKINSPCQNKRILRIFRNESVRFYGDYNLDIYLGTKHDYTNLEQVISKVINISSGWIKKITLNDIKPNELTHLDSYMYDCGIIPDKELKKMFPRRENYKVTKGITLRKDGNFIMYACETEKFYYVICFATS